TRCLSDWSSDVCSSDLVSLHGSAAHARADLTALLLQLQLHSPVVHCVSPHRHLLLHGEAAGALQADGCAVSDLHARRLVAVGLRSEERRVGKGCRSWWW